MKERKKTYFCTNTERKHVITVTIFQDQFKREQLFLTELFSYFLLSEIVLITTETAIGHKKYVRSEKNKKVCRRFEEISCARVIQTNFIQVIAFIERFKLNKLILIDRFYQKIRKTNEYLKLKGKYQRALNGPIGQYELMGITKVEFLLHFLIKYY